MKITPNHKVALLDVCTSDYFTGYHLPCLAVPIYNTVTCIDMAKEIETELNMTYDYINESDNKDIERLYEEYINELKSKGNEIFYECQDISENEDIECVYAYFSIINPVKIYGLTFLNP